MLGITFVDLQFDDDHVERWFGPGLLGSAPRPAWASRCARDVADGQAEALLSELA